MKRGIASLLLVMLACQFALAGAGEIQHCDEAAPPAAHHDAATPLEEAAHGDEIGNTGHDHHPDGVSADDSCGYCSGACVIPGALTRSTIGAAPLPPSVSGPSPAADSSSLYRPPAVS